MKRRPAIAALLLCLAAAMPFGIARADQHGWFGETCFDDGDTVYEVPADVIPGGGKFVLPSEGGTALVTFTHGYGHTSDSWVEHMQRAAEAGAIAFALDYPGTYLDDDGSVRGWFVREGAEASVEVARAIMQACEIDLSILHGVSMGGNTSGLALAMQPTRPGSGDAPLFDYWIAGEPAANLIETYLEATAVAPGVPFAAKARDDIEAEHGGTLWEQPESYAEGTVVNRVDDIAASGVKGVAIVHGFDDGLVPYNQSRELWALLRAHGVATDVYNAVRRETNGTPTGSDNTTLTENVLGPTGMYTEPLAGHGTESSQTHIVIQTGIELVLRLIAGDADAIPGDREFVVDGEAGIIPLV